MYTVRRRSVIINDVLANIAKLMHPASLYLYSIVDGMLLLLHCRKCHLFKFASFLSSLASLMTAANCLQLALFAAAALTLPGGQRSLLVLGALMICSVQTFFHSLFATVTIYICTMLWKIFSHSANICASIHFERILIDVKRQQATHQQTAVVIKNTF